MEFEPFTVPSIPADKLELLQHKLSETVYPNELEEDVNWKYGAPTWAVKPMAEKWAQSYDWETVRAEMNRWHHYRTVVDGLKIHYVHERSTVPDALPIVLVHGWPSTFYEFHKIIEPLRDGNGKQAFHVVVPSLPGFGFSEAPKTPGYGVKKMAKLINDLMVKLGYTHYVLHGGDWGAIIGKYVAANYSRNCKAFHTGLPFVLPPVPTPRNLLLHPFKVAKFFASLLTGFDWMYGKGSTILNGATFANAEIYDGCGYRAIQGTKPYTLAFGLSDSPLGLMAWMLEKYHEWTYHTPEQQEKEALPPTISADEFLTQVTLYWLTNSMSSSIRIYYECLQQKEMISVVLARVHVPVGVSAFAYDISKVPRDWLEASTNLHHYSEFKSGGHFPALEESKLLTNDILKFGKLLKDKAPLSKL